MNRPKAKEIFTLEEMIYLKSILNLNALEITEKLFKIAEEETTSEKEIKILKEQIKTIENIFDKLKEE